MNERQLLNLKEKIDESKIAVAELKGKQDHLVGELREQWQCKTVEEAEAQLKSMQGEAEKIDGQIDEKLDEVKRIYGELV